MSTTTVETEHVSDCSCKPDPQLDLLHDLIALGVGQRDATLLAFGHQPDLRVDGGNVLAWEIWSRLTVRRIANRARRQLALPEVPLLEVA